MKKLLILAAFIGALGAASAQTGKDTVAVKKNRKENTMRQDPKNETSSKSTKLDQNKASNLKDSKKGVQTSSTTRNPETTNPNNSNPVPNSSTETGGTIKNPAGSEAPKR